MRAWSVAVVQRTDGALRLNVHLHVLALDGVYVRAAPGESIVPLTGTTSEVHMREDLAIFEFELTPAECSGVAKLFV